MSGKDLIPLLLLAFLIVIVHDTEKNLWCFCPSMSSNPLTGLHLTISFKLTVQLPKATPPNTVTLESHSAYELQGSSEGGCSITVSVWVSRMVDLTHSIVWWHISKMAVLNVFSLFSLGVKKKKKNGGKSCEHLLTVMIWISISICMCVKCVCFKWKAHFPPVKSHMTYELARCLWDQSLLSTEWTPQFFLKDLEKDNK